MKSKRFVFFGTGGILVMVIAILNCILDEV